MKVEFENNLDSNQVAEVLKELSKKADNPASLSLGIEKAFNSELVDKEIIQDMRNVLYEEVGSSGWKSEWDA